MPCKAAIDGGGVCGAQLAESSTTSTSRIKPTSAPAVERYSHSEAKGTSSRLSNRVHPIDLPGHGADADGDTAAVRLEECVQAITRAVEREQLKDLVLVGHGFSGGLVLQAAKEMAVAPKRVVLLAGIIPAPQRPLLSACPQRTRVAFGFLSFLSTLSRQEFKLPRPAISGLICNGMEPMEVVQMVGFFSPLPSRSSTRPRPCGWASAAAVAAAFSTISAST